MLAPTGTISFMMDCDTTGVEPDFSLVKSKKLVGGGEITIVNKTVPTGAREARLRAARGRGDRRVRRRAQHRRRRAVREDRALPGVRLRGRRPRDPLPRPREDDGRDAAVHLGRDLEDGEPARRGDGRGRDEPLRRRVEARRQGDRDLPRQLQGRAAAVELGLGDATAHRRRCSCTSASGCRTTATRSAASSASATTRATSTSASSTTAAPATSSSTSRRTARRWRA